MMGAAMLKHHQFMWSLWASYGVQLVEMCMWRSQAQPLFKIENESNGIIACLPNGCHIRLVLQ